MMDTADQLVKVKIHDHAATEASRWSRAAFELGTWHERFGFIRNGTVSFFFESSADATLFRLKWADVIVPESDHIG